MRFVEGNVSGTRKDSILLFFSDIDLIVHPKDGRAWKPEELEGIMAVLRQAFCRHHICTDDGIQIITGATVPIIKLTDRKTDIKVDMSFNMNNGLRNAQLILVGISSHESCLHLL